MLVIHYFSSHYLQKPDFRVLAFLSENKNALLIYLTFYQIAK